VALPANIWGLSVAAVVAARLRGWPLLFSDRTPFAAPGLLGLPAANRLRPRTAEKLADRLWPWAAMPAIGGT
jgi:hypothetical protein